jgi:hypothetical protein
MHNFSFFQMNERVLEKKLKNQLKENLILLKDLPEGKVSSLEAISPAV